MSKVRLCGLGLLLALGVLTSGCISIEQEIFLQPDGSGDLLLLITLPDFPADMKSGGMSAGDPAEAMQKFKTEIATKLPPTIKLKEAKELKQNGTLGFYALFQFKDINEVRTVMTNVMKESAQGMSGGSASPTKPAEWNVKLVKQGVATNFTQTFYTDMAEAKVETSGNVEVSVKPPPKPAPAPSTARAGRRPASKAATKPAAADEASGGMKMEGMEGLAQMMLGAIKFRFTLHTPTPITSSNADLVLGGKTALWNCSLAAFAKEKRPIEMKASY
ncbi:MAG: hypothetical protein HYR56_03515 [Acidobacteria bacterium]|nr:hypothetical protein [Acidobacteriota bacterium]MBI3427029.1 hypothetical protein [Acidobacteriota bacterium]